jgi:hypothetical protein
VLLTDRTVVVYGIAADAVSRTAATALAAAGARCALVGTDPAALDSAAALARARGGAVETAVLDPADPAAVEDHLGALLRLTGGLDASVHIDPAPAAVRAVARRMAQQECGVVVLLVDPDPRRPDGVGPPVRLVTLAPDGADRIAELISETPDRTTTRGETP